MAPYFVNRAFDIATISVTYCARESSFQTLQKLFPSPRKSNLLVTLFLWTVEITVEDSIKVTTCLFLTVGQFQDTSNFIEMMNLEFY